jgi:hypothetical protein
MPTALKTSIAALVIVLGLASMGMVSLNDGLKHPEYCANCHADPQYSSWSHSDYLAAKHGKAAIRCQSCHPQTLDTGVHNVVEKAKGNEKLKRLRVPKQVCLQCHAHQSYAELVERTAGGKRNPHKSHYGDIDCRICHKMHEPSIDYCSACHDPVSPDKGWVHLPKMNIQRGKPPSVMPSELPH